MDRKKLFKHLSYLILFIFIVNFATNKFYWYYSIWYFDMIMHFLGGFWVGLAFFYFFSPKILFPDSFQFIFKVLFFVFLVGFGWEVYEVLVDKIITQNPLNILDISSDLFFDLSGGVFAVLYFFKRIMFIKENEVNPKVEL